jgi:hypothetical protein
LVLAVVACAHNNDRPTNDPSTAYENEPTQTPDETGFMGSEAPEDSTTGTTGNSGDDNAIRAQADSNTPTISPALSPASGTATERSGNTSSDPTSGTTTGKQPDNTGVNERDRNDKSLTPMDQGGSEADRKLTQQIRQAVMADDSLSFSAKNVKIITVDGRVTLRGPVKTAQERAAIESAATKLAGAGQVDSQLEIVE